MCKPEGINPQTRRHKGRRIDESWLFIRSFNAGRLTNQCPIWQHTQRHHNQGLSQYPCAAPVMASVIYLPWRRTYLVVISAYLQISASRGAVLSAPPSLVSTRSTVIHAHPSCLWATSTSLLITGLSEPAPSAACWPGCVSCPTGLHFGLYLLFICCYQSLLTPDIRLRLPLTRIVDHSDLVKVKVARKSKPCVHLRSNTIWLDFLRLFFHLSVYPSSDKPWMSSEN